MSDNNKYPYHKTRLDILGHIESGKLIGDKLIVWQWLQLRTAKEQNPGWYATNAPTIATHTYMTTKRAQNALSWLRANGYIYYGDNRGKKGPFKIFMNKWEITFYLWKGPDAPPLFIPYRTNLWDQKGAFIGEDSFFARIIVRKLHVNKGLRGGFIEGLSKRLNGQSIDFKSVFMQDFEEMTQHIDKYIKTIGLIPYLWDFTRDYPADFRETMKVAPYLSSSYNNTSKDLAPKLSTDIKKQIKGKLTELQGIWDDFNPGKFAGKYFTEGYGKKLPVSLLLHTLDGLIAVKHKADLNAWGYAQKTIDNEKVRFIGKESTRMSEQYKKDLADFAEEIWGKDKESHKGTEGGQKC